jgi:hypothetical protein
MFGCGWVQEHGGNGSQFPMNNLGKHRLLAYWHLPYPAVESSSTGRIQFNTKPFFAVELPSLQETGWFL